MHTDCTRSVASCWATSHFPTKHAFGHYHHHITDAFATSLSPSLLCAHRCPRCVQLCRQCVWKSSVGSLLLEHPHAPVEPTSQMWTCPSQIWMLWEVRPCPWHTAVQKATGRCLWNLHERRLHRHRRPRMQLLTPCR